MSVGIRDSCEMTSIMCSGLTTSVCGSLISTFTAGKTTEPAIDKAIEVLNKLHSTGINETSLASAKNYVKGQFPPRYETAGQLAGLMTQMFWYNFDESYINNFEKNVDGLTVDKAKQIIQNISQKINYSL